MLFCPPLVTENEPVPLNENEGLDVVLPNAMEVALELPMLIAAAAPVSMVTALEPVDSRVIPAVETGARISGSVPVIASPLIVLLVRDSLPASVASVPLVGKVTLVEPVVVRVNGLAPEVVNESAKEIFFPAVREIDSPPAREMELELRVVESERVRDLPLPRVMLPELRVEESLIVRVLPAARVSTPVPGVMVFPL